MLYVHAQCIYMYISMTLFCCLFTPFSHLPSPLSPHPPIPFQCWSRRVFPLTREHAGVHASLLWGADKDSWSTFQVSGLPSPIPVPRTDPGTALLSRGRYSGGCGVCTHPTFLRPTSRYCPHVPTPTCPHTQREGLCSSTCMYMGSLVWWADPL